MNQFNFNSIIGLFGEFFSELPPNVVGIISGATFFSLMIFSGFSIAFVLGILMLFFTQSGTILVGTYILCIAGFSIFGLAKGYQLYKKILLSYEISQT